MSLRAVRENLSVDELRREFDGAFTRRTEFTAAATEKLLAIRTGGQAYALRLCELAGLSKQTKVAPLPGANAALLGVAGVKGGLLPVFSLPVLLGLTPSARELGWMAICGAKNPICVAFEELEAYLDAPRSDIRAGENTKAAVHARETLRTAAGLRWILDIPSILKAIEKER